MKSLTEKTPSLCHVLHSLNVGGAEILAREFAVRCRDEFRVVFACLDELGSMAPQLRDAGFEVEVFDRQPGFDMRCLRRLANFFREQNVRLVHAHQYAPFFYSSLARWFGPRFPLVFTEHGRDYPDYRRWKRVWANKLLIRKNDQIIGVGQGVKDALVANEGISPKHIDVIYNGVDTKRYVPEQGLRCEVRRELGLDESQIAIIQVARLNRLKDHPTAMRAVQRLVQADLPVQLLVVGEGEERDALEALTRGLGIEDHVQFLGLRGDVSRLLQAADVFLLSSVSEGIPLTLIEGMLTGLPCVSTRVGGIPEVVIDGETGLLTGAGDDNALAAAVTALSNDAARRRQMGTAGRKRALEIFDDRLMHQTYQQLYRKLIGGPLDRERSTDDSASCVTTDAGPECQSAGPSTP